MIYEGWIFVDRLGAGYDLKPGEYPKCLYGKDKYGDWHWFKKSGEDYWIRREDQVPRRIRMAALLME